MHFRALLMTLATVATAVAPAAGATSLPESYPLPFAAMTPNPIDPNLQAWMDQHVEQPSPLDMPVAGFDAFVGKQDPATRLYLLLARAARDPAKSGLKQAVELARQALEQDGGALRSHPLAPFILMEMIESKALAPEDLAKTNQAMAQVGGGSCAQKRVTYSEISKDHLAAISDDALRDVLMRIDSFRSAKFKRLALRRFLDSLPAARQSAVAEKLVVMTAAFPSMQRGEKWLAALAGDAAAKATGAGAAQVHTALDQARKLAGQRQCSKAKDLVVDAVARAQTVKAKDTLEAAVNAAKAVDGCYRRRDAGMRREFWKGVTPKLEAAYGFGGWAEAKLRLGYIHWTSNEFEPAKALFDEVLGKAAKEKQRAYEARAVYALGRVAEDETDPAKASGHFKDYVTRFVDGENFEEALMALVLVYVDRQDWVGALQPLEAYIAAQTEKSIDERSVGGLSFALFWAGRGHLEQGNQKLAGEMWRRVASEFYSTYYGAMGHYVLEKMTGRVLALQPSRTPTFRMHDLREAFLPQDRARVRRVEAMMRLGMHNEAVCELEEIDTADGKPEKLLLRSIMLFASGRWLDAIKAYDALPRGYRNQLPTGFERILFPRRFESQVNELAKKANVDSDLVLALIRQESVFNPEARSPVGALGLMQLMPATAKLETKGLPEAYLPAGERKEVMARLANPRVLLTPETNLLIGVHHMRSLLSRYASPVHVLSAYNAGPAAAARWMNTIPTRDVLAFIEKIPYKETRAYVKLVLRNYFYYKRWYNMPTGTLPHLDDVASPIIAMVRGDGSAATRAADEAAATNH